MRHNVLNKFNRGEIDSKALSRDDVKKVRNTCALMNNFLPIRLGPMQYRPGWEYLDTVPGEAYCIPFIAADDDYALIEFTNNLMRVWVDDALITRTNVTTPINNGTFTLNITNWTDASGAGSSTAWVTGGYLGLTGADATRAVSYQTLSSTQTGAEHPLRIVVKDAPVLLQLGTSGAESNDITETTLLPGTHSLVFTPASNVTITFSNSSRFRALVDSVAFEGASTFSLPTDVATAGLPSIRYSQSADVIFVSYDSGNSFRVERRGIKSWSITDFRADDGPFGFINSSDISLTASALNGDITLTASDDHFTSDHVGALFKLQSAGQTVTKAVSAADDGTNSIFVTGFDTARRFTISISGTFVATITLQNSADGTNWSDTTQTYTAPVAGSSYDDNLDNSELYYRLYIKSGDYTSGTATLTLTYAAGSIDGIARVTAYTSATSVSAQVLQDFGSTDSTRNWFEGLWSDEKGHPSANALYEGRLWFAGKDRLWGSVSEAFTSYDADIEGNSKAISRTIGFGPVDTISWLIPSTRLIMGVATAEISVRSSTFGEPLTNDNTNLKSSGTQGVAKREPLQVDDQIYFVQRGTTKLYESEYSSDRDAHETRDTTLLHQNIASAGIRRIAVSRQPETRVWVILDDGDVRVYLVDRSEEVQAWSRIETTGDVEDIVVLPGTAEDSVYLVVNRSGGRYMEKMAKFTEAEGGNISKHFDSFKTYTSPGTTITGLSHVNGQTVGVWADGQDRGTYTVSSNQITVASSWTNVVVGLPYTANYTTSKLSGYLGETVINRQKRIVDVGFTLENYWPGSITIGPDTTLLESMPGTEDGTDVDTTATISSYDFLPFEFNGENETDPRIHVRCTGPATILSLSYGVDTDGDVAPSASEGRG